jgi:hypothetical protein
MTVIFTALAIVSLIAAVFTVLVIARDGHHRLPTRTF